MKILKIIFFFFILLDFSFLKANFADIENNIYKNYILDLAEKKVINTENKNFEPKRNISRAEFLAILLNITKTDLQDSKNCFSDVSSKDWFEKYVCTWKNLWFFSWYKDGTFKPNKSISMPEAYAIATKVFNLKLEENNFETWEEKYHDFIIKKWIFKENLTKNRAIKRWEVAKLLSVLSGKENNLEIEVKNITDWCFAPQKAESWKKEIIVAWKKRFYHINFPKNYNEKKEYKLLFAYHGRTVWADLVKNYMWLWNWKKWWNENYITVYPYGLWNWPYSWGEKENIDFFDEMLEKIWENYCIDKSKIFVVWHSLWWYMSNKLACLRGEIINSNVVVAWTNYQKNCVWNPSSANFHLENDNLVNFWNAINQVEFLKKSYNSKKEENIEIWWEKCKIFYWENEEEIIFCKDYKTLRDEPHGWPRNWGKMIFDFFERQK